MIHQARKLMKSALSVVKTEDDVVWVDYANKRFSLVRDANLPHIYSPFPEKETYVKGLITYLHDNGYITYQSDKNHFHLTYKAFYYDEFHKEERFDFWKRSVYIPLAVAIIGNIAVELFKATWPAVLQLLLQWLQ